MSEGGPSDDESDVKLEETLEDCLARLGRLEEEMFIKFNEPVIDIQSAEQTSYQKEEVERHAIWTRHNIKEMWCVYDIRALLEALVAEERSGRSWFEWLRWVLWGA
jgi:hypothetical protein